VTWLVRFGDPTWQQQLQQWARDFKFNATLKPRLDQQERIWRESQPAQEKPVLTHEKMNDKLQTGESRKLGGAMQIKAPWRASENDE
jgi:hypothetical protein